MKRKWKFDTEKYSSFTDSIVALFSQVCGKLAEKK
jgi:hypothetical protein